MISEKYELGGDGHGRLLVDHLLKSLAALLNVNNNGNMPWPF